MKEHKLINPNDPTVHCIQSRLGTSLEKIEEYTAMMQADIQFDPCAGFVDPNGDIWIYDGKHRRESAMQAGSMLLCELEPGTQQDAEWHAAHANTRHGLPRTRNDIINAVKIALRHPYGQQKSDRELALWCGCDHKTIGKYRKELEASGEIPQMQTRTITRGEQAYQMEIPVKTEPVEPKDRSEFKTTPTTKELKGVIKAFMSLEFPNFVTAREELDHLYSNWQAKEPYVTLVNKLKKHLESLYTIENFHFTTRTACLDALTDWNVLYNEGYRGVLEAEEEVDEEDEEHAFQARLERCRECLDKCYLVKIDGVFGVTKIYEVNKHLAKVRGVTYPYDPDVPFKGMAACTENFELEDLRRELTPECWETSKYRTMNNIKDYSNVRPEKENPEQHIEPEPEQPSEELKTENPIDIKEIHRLRRILQNPDIRDSRRFEAIDAVDAIEFFTLLHLLDWPDDLESLYVNLPSGRISTLRELRTPTETFHLMIQPSTLLEFWEPETKINDNDAYLSENESISGTPEYYFRQCTLDAWQIFFRYWYFKKEYGKAKSRLNTLELEQKNH